MFVCLFIFKNIKVVLNHIDAVDDGGDGDHEADTETQQDRTVPCAIHIAVENQIIYRSCRQSKHKDRVGHQPGDQQGTQGHKETKEQEQVGHEAHLETE